MNINYLPDVLILEIFGHLSIKQLCISSRVCRRWNKIACDKSLWREIDMSDTRLNLHKAWKFYRARLSDCLLKLKMRGYYHADVAIKQKKPVLSNALLQEIRTNCPNIRQITFECKWLEHISSKNLPRSLQSLTLLSCGWPVGWLKDAELPNLKTLSLLKCVRVDDSELKSVCALPSLKALTLKGMYRIKDEGIKCLAENMPQLTRLELLDIHSISDLAIHHLCRHSTNLENLSIEKCWRVGNSAIETITVSLTKLRSLNICDTGVDRNCLPAFLKMKQLKSLTFSIDPETVDKDVFDKLNTLFPGRQVNLWVN